MSHNPPVFQDLLIAAGAEFAYQYEAKCRQGLCYTTNYNIRFDQDEAEIGVRADFDRWANSRDFFCRPLPRTQEDFDALFGALDKAVKDKVRRDTEGSFDIWPLVRKYKRNLRKADYEHMKATKVPTATVKLKKYK